MKPIIKIGATLAVLATVAACAQGPYRKVADTDVRGHAHRVEQARANTAAYRAYGASRRARENPTNAYYARNVIAIRQVAGCPVRPDTIVHDKGGPNSAAAVVC